VPRKTRVSWQRRAFPRRICRVSLSDEKLASDNYLLCEGLKSVIPMLIVVPVKVPTGEGGGGATIGSSEKLCFDVLELELK
jgi:hypothetical protein